MRQKFLTLSQSRLRIRSGESPLPSSTRASGFPIPQANQSILKETNLDYSLEGLMLKLKLQYFGHLMQIANSLEKTLMVGNIEGRRRKGVRRWIIGWHHQLIGNESDQTLR